MFATKQLRVLSVFVSLMFSLSAHAADVESRISALEAQVKNLYEHRSDKCLVRVDGYSAKGARPLRKDAKTGLWVYNDEGFVATFAVTVEKRFTQPGQPGIELVVAKVHAPGYSRPCSYEVFDVRDLLLTIQ